MGIETERKFLVCGEGWRATAGPAARLRQGYLKTPEDGVSEVRVRITEPTDGPAQAELAVKSVGGLSRLKVEAPLALADAEQLLALCRNRAVAKSRHRVPAGAGLTFEVDVYEGPLAGLVTADCELPDESTAVPRPEWLGEEITGDIAFANATLAQRGLPPHRG